MSVYCILLLKASPSNQSFRARGDFKLKAGTTSAIKHHIITFKANHSGNIELGKCSSPTHIFLDLRFYLFGFYPKSFIDMFHCRGDHQAYS